MLVTIIEIKSTKLRQAFCQICSVYSNKAAYTILENNKKWNTMKKKRILHLTNNWISVSIILYVLRYLVKSILRRMWTKVKAIFSRTDFTNKGGLPEFFPKAFFSFLWTMKPEVQINLANFVFYRLQIYGKVIQCKNERQKTFIISFTWNIHLCNCFSCVVFSKLFINLIIESFSKKYVLQSARFFSITFKTVFDASFVMLPSSKNSSWFSYTCFISSNCF